MSVLKQLAAGELTKFTDAIVATAEIVAASAAVMSTIVAATVAG